ncbi:Opi1-domain-containing protein [Bimuria novae-zelandiae CBS 107.79]|uniref:Opi1-domain-containing protein n=1 Tax=Bimuria novae-zelandiae CBS 107.79 TaxID=1447943 RepID=A0A6A5UY62_9PLEO|nr:Opi1-domain-containing protein [Bimuria novae-zelandiae CBS 107.79]
MEQEQERAQPPAYTQHDPSSLNLPSVPTHTLPNLRSLDLPDTQPSRASVELSPKSNSTQWGALPPLSSATFPRAPEGDVSSPMALDFDRASVISGEDRRDMSVVSMEDPDVRLAAEALSGLGNPDFVRSPTSRSVTLSARESTAAPEPLLNLLTTAHPWLGGSINGSISAYNTTKTYSPRFLKYGAELIERNIGSPVVNTVSSVGKRTGVEQNLRRYLGEVHRRPSDLEQGDADSSRKRARVMSPQDGHAADAMDIESPYASSRIRGDSQSSYAESLPAYDEYRSPKYEETAVVVDPLTGKPQPQTQPRDQEDASSSSQDRHVNWSTQLIMTTSGLGVALSDASLKSLKLCLGLLRSATKHIDQTMTALKLLLDEYEAALRNSRHTYPNEKSTDVDGMRSTEEDPQVRALADKMKAYSGEIWKTLQSVVTSVSRYTGGALPQNASQVVRTQLLSVPQRWQLAARTTASDNDGGEGGGEEVRGANRMLAFAREGLDMMGQITAVVDGTVQSADAWLARIGRQPQSQNQTRREEKGMLLEGGMGGRREHGPAAFAGSRERRNSSERPSLTVLAEGCISYLANLLLLSPAPSKSHTHRPPTAWQPLSIYNDDVGSARLPTGIDATDPFALFSLFFDAAQLEKLALHTNQHAEQVRAEDAAQGRPHARAWKPTSKTELYTYLTILMYMGVHRDPTIEEYWGKLHKNAPTYSINNYMACTRWQQLNRYMYCIEAP